MNGGAWFLIGVAFWSTVSSWFTDGPTSLWHSSVAMLASIAVGHALAARPVNRIVPARPLKDRSDQLADGLSTPVHASEIR